MTDTKLPEENVPQQNTFCFKMNNEFFYSVEQNTIKDKILIEERRQERRKKKMEDYTKENGEFDFDDFMRGNRKPSKSSSSRSKVSNYKKINFYPTLAQLGIIIDNNTPKDDVKVKFREWMILNHPDRGGDGDLFAKALDEYKLFMD